MEFGGKKVECEEEEVPEVVGGLSVVMALDAEGVEGREGRTSSRYRVVVIGTCDSVISHEELKAIRR